MSIDRAMSKTVKRFLNDDLTVLELSKMAGLSVTELKNAMSNKVPWQMKRVSAVAKAVGINTWQLVKLAESILIKEEG